MLDSQINIPDCLQASICPNCGYSLIGLPPTNPCPECGRLVDRSQIVLYGDARGARINLGNVKGWRRTWPMIPVGVGLVILAQDLYASPLWSPRISIWPLIIIVLLLIPKLLHLFRPKTDFPGSVQIRLSRRGCAQYDVVPGPSTIEGFLRANKWLIPATIAFGLLLGYRFHALTLGWAVNGCIIFAIAAFFMWFDGRRIRRNVASLGESALMDQYTAYKEPTPWYSVRHYELEPLDGGNCRLRIEHDDGGYPVDAEIQCSPQQGFELNRWLSDRFPNPRKFAAN